MLIVTSPATRLDRAERPYPTAEPAFHAEANRLAGHARQLTLARLQALMHLSDDLARLNRDRFRAFAKKVRGSVARFIVENRITDSQGLSDFDLGGYRFVETGGGDPVFHRQEAAAA